MASKDSPTTTKQELMEIDIAQEKMDSLTRLAEDSILWVKVTESGFLIDDKLVPELLGVIVNFKVHWVKWTDGRPTKISLEDGKPAPDGYELGSDLKLYVPGAVIGLSLSKSSTKFQFSRYAKFLERTGRKLNRVVTRLRCRTVTNRYGKFAIVVFEYVGPFDPSDAAIQTDWDPADNDSKDAPQETPAKQAAANPWA